MNKWLRFRSVLIRIHFPGQERFENHMAPSCLTMGSCWTILIHFTITFHACSKSSITSRSISPRPFLHDWSLHVSSLVNGFYFLQTRTVCKASVSLVKLQSMHISALSCQCLTASPNQMHLLGEHMTGTRFGTAWDRAGQQFQWLCLKSGSSLLTCCYFDCCICSTMCTLLTHEGG